MIEIDGFQHSGSGTIVRYSAALAAFSYRDLHLINIRAKKEKPGLRAQHLKALEALGEITQGTLEDGHMGSAEIYFKSGRIIRGGEYEWNIGTAGSTTIMAVSILPVAAFADRSAAFKIAGGLFQDSPRRHIIWSSPCCLCFRK
ncbi:MAG: RNA 3'-terminal phosphate cyclase [Candidatus Binatia bacterium]|jgi:RNA 3'-terminal phosphate cyclase (ATP)|nr:RNA 3'-terminal phosphate cyclase [Candidatus Binatia bacterium]